MTDRAKAYKEAGVDIDAANVFVKGIKDLVGSTFTKGVITNIGGFGGLFKLNLNHLEEPVLAASTDGVGTKLLLTSLFDRHDTIGIDLVAMSVNDIIVQGAQPLFFLDYLATGRLEVEKMNQLVAGVVDGCKQAGCALLGGETAEMPGLYADDEYDMSGFCLGIVDNAKIVDGSNVAVGDSIIGLASSGLHSNGFSLVRKIFEASGLKGEDPFPGASASVADVLLTPTQIYVRQVANILRDLPVKAMAHITGGGFYDNIPRVLPNGVVAEINFGTWAILPVFQWIKEEGNLSWPEMLQIFNSGIGYAMIVGPEIKADVLARLEGLGQNAWEIGVIRQRKQDDTEQVVVNFP